MGTVLVVTLQAVDYKACVRYITCTLSGKTVLFQCEQQQQPYSYGSAVVLFVHWLTCSEWILFLPYTASRLTLSTHTMRWMFAASGSSTGLKVVPIGMNL